MEEVIKAFLGYGYGDSNGDGYGDGYGDSNGDGNGDGFGYGDGFGFGNGNGDGFGDGFGFGNGDGNGDGNSFGSGFGSGFGDGSGFGNGFGYGYGDGIKNLNGYDVHVIDGIQTIIYSVKHDIAKGSIIQDDLTLQPCYVAKVDNSFAHADSAEQAHAEAQEKALKLKPVEDRIAEFLKAYPDPDEKHSGAEFFHWHHLLTGSCEMGRKQFCRDNNLDIDADYTSMQFLNICKNAYGSDIIRQVISNYAN